MKNKKTKININRVWVVISSDGFHSAEVTFKKAEEQAQALCDGNTDVRILEVVAAWDVEYPDEPDPIAFEIKLGEL